MRTKYPIDRYVTYRSEIAIVQLRAMGTDHAGEDDTSQGLLRRLLSPGTLRLSRGQRDQPTASPSSGDEDDSIPELRDNDEDEDYEMEYSPWGRPLAQTPKWFSPVTVPQEAGLKLLMGGEFGRIGVEALSRKGCANISKAILSSRSKLRPTPRQDITNVCARFMLGISRSWPQDIIPNTAGTAVASLGENIYCGQYSAGSCAPSPYMLSAYSRSLDSSFYYTCCRGKLRSSLSI